MTLSRKPPIDDPVAIAWREVYAVMIPEGFPYDPDRSYGGPGYATRQGVAKSRPLRASSTGWRYPMAAADPLRARWWRAAAKLWLLLALAFAFALPAVAGGGRLQVEVTLAPAAAQLEGKARITWSGTAAPLHWQLAEELQVHALTHKGRRIPFTRKGRSVYVTLPPAARSLEWRFGGALRGPPPLQLTPEGSWLSGDAAWFPQPAGYDDVALTVTITAPADQRAVLTGTLLEESVDQAQSRATFRAHRGQPPSLFVGPYVVRERQHGSIRLRTYFHREADGLADAFLDAAVGHIDRFASVIGPFPYDGFFMVSSPHPVGLGFPGLTYVARRILHLPFMRGQSLAHEILHCWWGNAVQVAHGSGNWAEGLTTFMADYRGGASGERERMRREWLRDYAALPPTQDYPLSRFQSRLHARDLVVGYGKGAFVFEMLEQRIGTVAFHAGVAQLYGRHRTGAAGWAQVQAAFEAASGESLGRFFTQWVERTGAPRLSLSQVVFGDSEVRFVLTQSPGDYALSVPVRVATAQGEQRFVVEQHGREQSVRLVTAGRPQALRVDPQLEVFRQLVPGELAPTLRDVTLADEPQAIMADPAAQESARALISAVLPMARSVDLGQWNRALPGLVIGLGEPQALATRLGLPLPEIASPSASAWVWMAQGTAAPTMVVAARDPAALAALVRPLPHYGRDSWLAFRDGTLLARGTWRPSERHALSAER